MDSQVLDPDANDTFGQQRMQQFAVGFNIGQLLLGYLER